MISARNRSATDTGQRLTWLSFSIVMGMVQLGSVLYAEDGLIKPDSARIEFTYEIDNTITTIRLRNLTSYSVRRLCFSYHSAIQPDLKELVIDDQVIDPVLTEVEFSTVIPGWFTVRWEVGDFVETVDLKYASPFFAGSYSNWSAGHPYPVFGMGSGQALSCCSGRVGDANGRGGDEPTLGDIARVVDYLFLGGTYPVCVSEADIDLSGGLEPLPEDITIGDVATLIDYLFISGPRLGLAECPQAP